MIINLITWSIALIFVTTYFIIKKEYFGIFLYFLCWIALIVNILN